MQVDTLRVSVIATKTYSEDLRTMGCSAVLASAYDRSCSWATRLGRLLFAKTRLDFGRECTIKKVYACNYNYVLQSHEVVDDPSRL
jgi:hypothetical protein